MRRYLLLLIVFLLGLTGKGFAQTSDESSPFEVIEVSPADGSIVLSLKQLKLTLSFEASIGNKDLKASVKNSSGDEVTTGTLKEDSELYEVINVILDKSIEEKGIYTVTIPEGAIKEYDGERVTAEINYTFTVDPDYWDPNWVTDLTGGENHKNDPNVLIAGRKYNLKDFGTTYTSFTAEESGRIYFKTNTTSSTTIRLCDTPENSWYIQSTLDGAKDATTGFYNYWLGVEKGKTYYLLFYYVGKAREFELIFETGKPYEDITMTEASHQNGDFYSRSIRTTITNNYGSVDFRFSTGINAEKLKAYITLPTKENQVLDVTDKIVLGSQNLSCGILLRDTINVIKEQQGLKSGDKIQLTLEGVEDGQFPENKLTESLTVELVLAGIICTEIRPEVEYAVAGIPEEIRLTFDGKVTYGGGYIYALEINGITPIPAENFVLGEAETNRFNITTYAATLKLPKVVYPSYIKEIFIVLENLKDENGNVISNNDEGIFLLKYTLTDDRFEPQSTDPAAETKVTSIQTIKFTFEEEANLVKADMRPYATNYDDVEVEGTLSIDANDSKTVILTLDKAITTPGEYDVVIPTQSIYNYRYNADKEDLGLADGAIYNPDINVTLIIPANFSKVKVESISPDIYENTEGTVDELPTEVVVTFNGKVKEVTAAYGYGTGGSSPFTTEEIPEGADIFTTQIDGNKVTILIPDNVIAANPLGEYQIILGAMGEDDKMIGNNPYDEYDDHVVFNYVIQPSLKLSSYTPDASVVTLDKMVLTFAEELYPEYDPDEMSDFQNRMKLKSEDNKIAGGKITVTFNGADAILTLENPITEKGLYTLSIPAGMFYEKAYDPMGWDFLSNREIEITFEVGADGKAEAIKAANTAIENAETTKAKYENPVDNAGLAVAIEKVKGLIDELSASETVSVKELNTAVVELETILAEFVKENEEILSITEAEGKVAPVKSVKYFTLGGIELAEPTEGIVIKKTFYEDGTVTILKIITK